MGEEKITKAEILRRLIEDTDEAWLFAHETRADVLFEWAIEQRLMKDPRRIAKLYDEARRRWGPTRYETSKIIEATLDKLSSPRVKPGSPTRR